MKVSKEIEDKMNVIRKMLEVNGLLNPVSYVLSWRMHIFFSEIYPRSIIFL